MSMRGYGIMIAAFFTVSIAYGVRYGYGMLLPGMLDSLKISKTEAGLISSAYFATYTIFSPVLGLLSDRFGSRLLLTLFPALLATGALLMGHVDTVGEASLVFSLAGLGHAACWAPVVSLVQKWVDDRHRGTALAVATMGSGIGIAAWSLWLPVVVEQSSYRDGWLHMGLFGFGVAALNFLLIRDPHAPLPEPWATAGSLPGKPQEKTYSYLQLLGDRRLWLVGASYACIGFTVLVPFTFLGVYATKELQLPYGTAIGFFTVMAVAGIAGKLILGTLSDRIGRVTAMMLCGLCLGFGCLGFIHLGGLAGKYLSAGVVGLGFGGVWPVYAAAAPDYFPRAMAGSVIGLWTVFMGIGSILSPIICGWTIDTFATFSRAFYLGWALSMAAVVLLLPLRGESAALRQKHGKVVARLV